MNNEKIIENMKAVLKSTSKSKARKKRHKKSNNNNNDEPSSADEVIADLMSKNWKMKSPQDDLPITPKVNAFEKLMKTKKKESPDATTATAQPKQKRKYTKKKNKSQETERDKIDTESDLSILDEESLIQMSKRRSGTSETTAKTSPPLNSIQKFLGLSSNDNDDNKMTRKRNRGTDETTSVIRHQEEEVVEEKTPKRRRKVKDNKMLLDSNENMEEEETARPRRSCANKINYSLLESPDKKSPEKQKKTKKKKDDEDFHAIEIDENLPIKSKKLAPLFIKKLPKPLIDPAVIEARQSFLFSTELPSNIRATIDRQRQVEEEILSNDLVAFPLVSHVTQLPSATSEVCNFKDSKIKINDEEEDEQEVDAKIILNCGQFTSCSLEMMPVIINETPLQLTTEDVKATVKSIKDSSGKFPVNRLFKQLLKKHKKASSNASEISFHNSLFIDVFRPSKFDEYLIATRAVEELKKFLTTWNDRNNKFDGNDSDSNSRSSWKGPSHNNYVVLSGGNGSGKTSSVYALANDLNYEVIEINAGSRRSGKKLLQDLYEATQSHRVEHLELQQSSDTARTIILIEDAEIAFDMDDGFISSIQQLINISKRPVILTTNNRSCLHLQKFIQFNEIIFESPINSMTAKYLSLLSLTVASSHRHRLIDVAEIEQLFSHNEFDLRKTINELEFFIRSEDVEMSGKRSSLMEFYVKKKERCRNLAVRNSSSIMFSDFTYKKRFVEGRELSHHSSNLMNDITNFIDGYHQQDMDEVKVKR